MESTQRQHTIIGRAPWPLSAGALALFAVAAAGGCAAELDDAPPSEPVALADGELGLGSRGEAVRDVYDHLTRYGYFPNPELSARYPGFAPLVAQAPADPSVFDERMQAAVERFQEQMGLEITGVVDAATRAALTHERCPWPDGHSDLAHHAAIDADGLRDKFASKGGAKRERTWSVESWPSGMSEATFAAHVQNALNVWKTVYDSQFTRVARGTGELKVRWKTIDGPPRNTDGVPGCDAGCIAARYNPVLLEIEIDSEEPWVFSGNPTTWPQVDFLNAVSHEWGHALGFDHSAFPESMMYAQPARGTTVPHALSADDRLGVRASFGVWGNVSTPAPVKGIGLGVQLSGGGTSGFFILTNETTAGGFKIYKWNGTGWTNIPGGALTIAADSRGRPWITDNNGLIKYRGSNGNWRSILACATDVDVSNSGLVVMRGCDGHAWIGNMDASASDATLDAQLNSGFVSRPLPNGRTLRALAAGSTGTGWAPVTAVDSAGKLWALSFNWFELTVEAPINLTSVASSSDLTTIWGVSSGGVFARNVQSAINSSTPARSGWVGKTGLNAVSVDTNDGRPYVVTSDGLLKTTTK